MWGNPLPYKAPFQFLQVGGSSHTTDGDASKVGETLLGARVETGGAWLSMNPTRLCQGSSTMPEGGTSIAVHAFIQVTPEGV